MCTRGQLTNILLCRNDKIEVLSPQDDSKPGDKVYVEGYEGG